MLRPKKNSYKEFDNEKKFLRLKNSPPPHNFSNGPSLRRVRSTVRGLAVTQASDHSVFALRKVRLFFVPEKENKVR